MLVIMGIQSTCNQYKSVSWNCMSDFTALLHFQLHSCDEIADMSMHSVTDDIKCILYVAPVHMVDV